MVCIICFLGHYPRRRIKAVTIVGGHAVCERHIHVVRLDDQVLRAVTEEQKNA